MTKNIVEECSTQLDPSEYSSDEAKEGFQCVSDPIGERSQYKKRLELLARLERAATNVTAQFERLYDWPRRKLSSQFGFMDESLIVFEYFGNKYYFGWYPTIIILGEHAILWNRGVVSDRKDAADGLSEQRDETQDHLRIHEAAVHMLTGLGLKPLEDGDCPTIQVHTQNDQLSAVFYFNHEFPSGWSENHCIPLEDKISKAVL